MKSKATQGDRGQCQCSRKSDWQKPNPIKIIRVCAHFFFPSLQCFRVVPASLLTLSMLPLVGYRTALYRVRLVSSSTTALPRAVSRPAGCYDRTEEAFYKAARNGSVNHLISHEIQRRILVAKRRGQAVLWLAGYSGHKRQRCLQSSGRYKAYQAPGRHTGRYVTSAHSIITLFNIACRTLIECSRPFAHRRCYRRQD